MDLNYKIFFILLTLLTFIFIITSSQYRKTEENYLSLHDSKEIFEDMDYFNHFSELDRKLRNCGSSNQECLENYSKSVLEFSKLEKKMISTMILDFQKKINYKYPQIFQNIKFIKVKNQIENSMPHTRKNTIVFSKSYFNSLLAKYRGNQHFLLDDLNLIRLISHEQFHIYQRNNPDIFQRFYETEWNLLKLPMKLPDLIKNLNRTNPDALPDNNWLFKLGNNKFILPLCIYNSTNSSNINDTSNIFVNVVQSKTGKITFPELEKDLKDKNLLSENIYFTKFFGYQGANNYHPHEISASLFEDMIEYDLNKRKNTSSENNNLRIKSQAFRKLYNYLQ